MKRIIIKKILFLGLLSVISFVESAYNGKKFSYTDDPRGKTLNGRTLDAITIDVTPAAILAELFNQMPAGDPVRLDTFKFHLPVSGLTRTLSDHKAKQFSSAEIFPIHKKEETKKS